MKPKRNSDNRKYKAILKAAITLFLKHGYSKTSMDAIAKEAGVTKQTVYAHYHSKDMLFTEIVSELCRKHAPSKSLCSAKEHDIECMLFKLGMSFLNMITSKEGLATVRLVIAESRRHPKLAQRYYESGSRRMLSIVADFLEQQNQLGHLHIPVPLSAASYFFSMLKGTYYVRTLFNIKPLPSPGEKETHVRESVRIFMRVYGGSNPLHTSNT